MDSNGLVTDVNSLYKTKTTSQINNKFQEELLMSIMQESDDETSDVCDESGSGYHTSSICLITHEPLKDYSENEIFTLQCGHTFLKSALFKEVCQQKEQNIHFKSHYFSTIPSRYFICPYCREKHNKPFPAWIGYPIIPRVNGVRKRAGQSYCIYEHTKGKKKGQYCGLTINFGEYCERHQDIMDSVMDSVTDTVEVDTETQNKCQAVLKSGAKKGTVCGNKAKYKVNNMSFCGRHKKHINNQ